MALAMANTICAVQTALTAQPAPSTSFLVGLRVVGATKPRGPSLLSSRLQYQRLDARSINACAVASEADTESSEKGVSRKDFPEHFLFGTGISAFQAEGAPEAGGKGSTIWDSYVQIPGKITDGSVNYPGCEFYYHYEEDITRAKELGFSAFRFSICWTRIYPNGGQPGEVASTEGIQFYNRVINAIIKAGMTPLVTLFHWEVPLVLENDPEVLGFRTKNIVPYFVKLCDTCFKNFGDRVKLWATINEMHIFSTRGYAYGAMAPGRCSSVSGNTCFAGDSATECYQVGHNILLAHAKVYRLYCNKYKPQQQGLCGFNPNHSGALPSTDKQEDRDATERCLEFQTGWQLDPVVFGHYPQTMRHALGKRLPTFTAEESEELKNSFDFLGHNYYTAYFVKHETQITKNFILRWYGNDGRFTTSVKNDAGQYIGEQMGPEGSFVRNCAYVLPKLLEWMKKRYGNIPCYITENGCMDKEPTNALDSLNDQNRIRYISDHLKEISKAIREKEINVIGYFVWSFMDVFEWDGGYTRRFGLVRVDFESDPPKRTNKSSAEWFKKLLT